MAHEIETMAYTNEAPWHGLGVHVEKAPSVEKMLELAGLDWKIEMKPIIPVDVNEHGTVILPKRLQPVVGKYAMVRNTDGKVFDIAGKQYIPTQPAEAFSFFKEFVEAGKATMETAGSLRGGEYLWGLAKLNSSFKLKGDDEVKGYILVGSPNKVGNSFFIKMVAIRVVCMNTFSAAIRGDGQEFRMPHRCKFDEFMIDKAKETLGLARDNFADFEKAAKQFQKLNMNWNECIKILAPIYQPDVEDIKTLFKNWDDVANKTMKELREVMNNAPGAQPDNGWGLLNAVTYHADHVSSRTADKRLQNAWMGHTARKKEQVFNKLLAMV